MVPGGDASELIAVLESPVPSTVRDRQGGGLRLRRDSNGFISALAARAWRSGGGVVPGVWLDTLESCRAGDLGFSFWPQQATPSWAPRLVPDTDDSAVMALELLHAGRLGLPEARRIACLGVAAHRLRQVRRGPVWPRVGMFATWQRAGARTDLVDCTVAVNALALLAATGLLGVSGVAETVAAISAGVDWAGADEARLSSLSPFYPEPDELRLAVAHAVAAGCTVLAPVADILGDARLPDPDAAVCSSPYGLVTWHSRELQAVRAAS